MLEIGQKSLTPDDGPREPANWEPGAAGPGDFHERRGAQCRIHLGEHLPKFHDTPSRPWPGGDHRADLGPLPGGVKQKVPNSNRHCDLCDNCQNCCVESLFRLRGKATLSRRPSLQSEDTAPGSRSRNVKFGGGPCHLQQFRDGSAEAVQELPASLGRARRLILDDPAPLPRLVSTIPVPWSC